jgi:TPR repeat protein
MQTRGVILGTLALLSTSIAGPHAAAEAQENPTTPGAIPNPGTYQGSMELQRQSDERDRQQREEQARQSQQQQQQYEQNQRQQQQRVISGNGRAAQQSSGPHRVPPRVPINFAAVTRASEAFGRHEYATAVAIVRPLATRGDIFAQYLLAAMYDNGKALPENHAMALQWYQRSAAAGFTMSMRNLGTMYRNGEATGHPDYVQAYRWYTLSLTHAVPGEMDDERLREINQDLSEVAVKMSGPQLAQAKALARQSNIPYLGD